jgi:hypothetical protein
MVDRDCVLAGGCCSGLGGWPSIPRHVLHNRWLPSSTGRRRHLKQSWKRATTDVAGVVQGVEDATLMVATTIAAWGAGMGVGLTVEVQEVAEVDDEDDEVLLTALPDWAGERERDC